MPDPISDAGDVDADLAAAMMRMVGSRNVAIHEYRALNLGVVRAVATAGLGDLVRFARWMIGRAAA